MLRTGTNNSWPDIYHRPQGLHWFRSDEQRTPKPVASALIGRGYHLACRWLVTGGSAGPPCGICLEGMNKAKPHILATSSHAPSGRAGGLRLGRPVARTHRALTEPHWRCFGIVQLTAIERLSPKLHGQASLAPTCTILDYKPRISSVDTFVFSLLSLPLSCH